MATEAPIPTSAVLVYDLDSPIYKPYGILIAESIVDPGYISLPEGKANLDENPADCALRVLQQLSGLQLNSRENLIQEYPQPLTIGSKYGVLAFSLFSCNFADTDKKLLERWNQADSPAITHFVSEQNFFSLAMSGQIDMANLAGDWQKRINSELKERRRRKPKN